MQILSFANHDQCLYLQYTIILNWSLVSKSKRLPLDGRHYLTKLIPLVDVDQACLGMGRYCYIKLISFIVGQDVWIIILIWYFVCRSRTVSQIGGHHYQWELRHQRHRLWVSESTGAFWNRPGLRERPIINSAALPEQGFRNRWCFDYLAVVAWFFGCFYSFLFYAC